MSLLDILVVVFILLAAIIYASSNEKKQTATKHVRDGAFGCLYIIIMLLLGGFIVFVVFG